jgi:hypothetical protein
MTNTNKTSGFLPVSYVAIAARPAPAVLPTVAIHHPLPVTSNDGVRAVVLGALVLAMMFVAFFTAAALWA